MQTFKSLLHEKFGMQAFRPGQEEAMQTLFTTNRLLCIQPTGYGKSLLYQIPSCILGGITLVISPLLALMRDQIDQLTHRFQIPATSINSDQTQEENDEAIGKILRGEIQILFTSPEQLDHIDRFEFFKKLPITLLVIDEAHCISTWGHDFRPSYRGILRFSRELKIARPDLKVLALTATADARVEKDIAAQLETVHVWREGMDRPNLHLSVHPAHGMAAKLTLCEMLLSQQSGNGLIYCATRENTELVADYLKEKGLDIIAYHAGLDPDEKRKIQTDFSKNNYRIIAATTALGMGIDKKDIRFIIHFDIPGSITAYYQEVGRSGRDGQKADGILLYDKADRKVQDYFIESALPSEEDFQKVLDAVEHCEERSNLTFIKRKTGLHPTRVTIVLAELIEQEFLKKESVKGVQIYQIDKKGQKLELSRYTIQHQVKTAELNKMIGYAESKACRMQILRQALGDPSAMGCERCDFCLKQAPLQLPEENEAVAWFIGRTVTMPAVKTHRISAGLSLFDGKLRTLPFIRFMKGRAHTEEIDPEILQLLLKHSSSLGPIGAIAPLPSTTWLAQMKYAKALSDHFKAPLINLLSWKNPPEKRQGELLNNDQRHYNVHERMQAHPAFATGAILLLDDYTGSGATLKEAARAIRKVHLENEIIPITIASVKWRLGQPGFI